MIGAGGRSAVCAVEDRVGEPVAVAVLGELAAELVDEQAAVREDQDAFGARRLDEARRRRSSCPDAVGWRKR